MEDGKPAVASSADASPADDTPGAGRVFRRWVAAAVAVGHRDVAALGALRQAVVKAVRVWPLPAAGCLDAPVSLALWAMAVVQRAAEPVSLPLAGACLACWDEPPVFGPGGRALLRGDRLPGGWDVQPLADRVGREQDAPPDAIWLHEAFVAAVL